MCGHVSRASKLDAEREACARNAVDVGLRGRQRVICSALAAAATMRAHTYGASGRTGFEGEGSAGGSAKMSEMNERSERSERGGMGKGISHACERQRGNEDVRCEHSIVAGINSMAGGFTR